jgi:RHS repeat-associated protein
MQMVGRSYSATTQYRYGFNGKEKSNEINGEGVDYDYDYGFRIYDSRIGKFLSVDPLTKKYPELTPYQFASNTPIQAVDLDGLEAFNGWNLWHYMQAKSIFEKIKAENIAIGQQRAEGLTNRDLKILNKIYTEELPSGRGKKFGDWEDVKGDAGGLTKFGIAKTRSWSPAAKINGLEKTDANLKNLSVAQADKYYKQEVIGRYQLNSINNEGLAIVIGSQATLRTNAVLTDIRAILNESYGYKFKNDPLDPAPLTNEEVNAINKINSKEFGTKLLDRVESKLPKNKKGELKNRGWGERIKRDKALLN